MKKKRKKEKNSKLIETLVLEQKEETGERGAGTVEQSLELSGDPATPLIPEGLWNQKSH